MIKIMLLAAMCILAFGQQYIPIPVEPQYIPVVPVNPPIAPQVPVGCPGCTGSITFGAYTPPTIPGIGIPAVPLVTQTVIPPPPIATQPPIVFIPPIVPIPTVPVPPIVVIPPLTPPIVAIPIATQPPIVIIPPIVSIPPIVNQPPQIPPPPGMTYGAYNQLCGITSDAVCATPQSSAFATDGFMNCEADFSCCLCHEIVCNECILFQAGPSAVTGVQAIQINGRSATNGGAASIICDGAESCQNSVITATNVYQVVAGGDMSMKNGMVTITNPQTDFKFFCDGANSCEGLHVEIIIPPPPAGTTCGYQPFYINTIDCAGQASCKNMQLTIRNNGCNKVLIEKLVCTEIDSCTAAHFNFIGDVETVDCDLGPSGHTAYGLGTCYQGLQALLCQDPDSCRGIRKALTNPALGFGLECGALGSCQSAQFTLNFDTRPWMDQVTGNAFREHTEWIDGFKFSGESSGALATVVINNNQEGNTLQVEKIECVAMNACSQMTIITGPDVEIVELLCFAQTCDGCLVKEDVTDVGEPCSTYAPP